jgi:type I restriction enzyme S subunit
MSRVFLGDVAIESRETYKGDKTGVPVVGLNHLVSEEIKLTDWDMGTENTFSKYFIEGDVLFGRRRAYLKKAVVAPFSGICSGDITVIRAKDGGILPELLPFVIQNDELFSYAVNKSAGSLSPRVKWSRLKQFEFELPDLVKQTELADLLWSMEDTKAAYKNLLEQTDDLIEARFIEMFGDINSVNVYPRKQWKKVLEIISGKDHKDVSDPNGKYPVYGSGGLTAEVRLWATSKVTIVVSSFSFPPQSMNM